MHGLIRGCFIAAMGFLLAAAASLASAGAIQYRYEGNAFANVPAAYPLSHVQISFVVDDSLVPANSSVQFGTNSPGVHVDYTFFDGYQTLTGDPDSVFGIYTSANFSFDTDANRNIVGNWNVAASRAHGGPEGLSLDDAISTAKFLVYPPTGAPYAEDATHSVGRFAQTLVNSPGTWTHVAIVPEPAESLMWSAGLVLLGIVEIRRRRR